MRWSGPDERCDPTVPNWANGPSWGREVVRARLVEVLGVYWRRFQPGKSCLLHGPPILSGASGCGRVAGRDGHHLLAT